MEETYEIKFGSTDLANSNKYAVELREFILDEASKHDDTKIDVNIEKDNKETMDFGGTLAVILGTPAVVVLAKAIGNWLKMRHSVKISISTKDGK